jgi:sulfur-oxidizing protein SoxA
MKRSLLTALPLAAILVATVQAESTRPDPEEVLRGLIEKSGGAYLTQSEQNLMMMADNPANWTIDEGKELFHTKRGPKNASMEGCDFGKGPGVLEGAYVELPRYFADAGKVLDLEGRIIYCMMNLQGFKADDPEVKKHHGSDSDQMKLQAYISAQSNGMNWNPPLDHPLEKAMRDAGEVIFNRRSGTMDFSCAGCHSDDAKRIRASVLPNVNDPAQWTKAISWPAFRAGQDNLRSSQHRLSECYWQMRQAEPVPASDATIAIISYWTDKARGQPAILPDMKR